MVLHLYACIPNLIVIVLHHYIGIQHNTQCKLYGSNCMSKRTSTLVSVVLLVIENTQSRFSRALLFAADRNKHDVVLMFPLRMLALAGTVCASHWVINHHPVC